MIFTMTKGKLKFQVGSPNDKAVWNGLYVLPLMANIEERKTLNNITKS